MPEGVLQRLLWGNKHWQSRVVGATQRANVRPKVADQHSSRAVDSTAAYTLVATDSGRDRASHVVRHSQVAR
eukprot:4307271-Amphidinium_carterae.1